MPCRININPSNRHPGFDTSDDIRNLALGL